MNQIRILHNSYKSSHPPLVSVSSVHFMNQTERLLRKWREYFLDLKDMRLFLAIAEENKPDACRPEKRLHTVGGKPYAAKY